MIVSAKKILASLALLIVALALDLRSLRRRSPVVVKKNRAVPFPRYHTDYRYGQYMIRGIRPGVEFWHTSVDGSWKVVSNSRVFAIPGSILTLRWPKPSGC